MNRAKDYYPDCPEALIVNLARSGDRNAFAELVRRHQSSVRNLMRRFSRDPILADDLAQQTFLRVWMSLKSLKEAKAFAGWLKKIAVSIWLQHLRKNDVLNLSDEWIESDQTTIDTPGLAMDLNQALITLPESVRLCLVLSYQEGMSHEEISKATRLPLGTIKSHIKRGSEKLRGLLAAYRDDKAEIES